MTYTRKPRQSWNVTFEVSWLDQPVTVPAVSCMSLAANQAASNGDILPMIRELPSDLSALLEQAMAEEVLEFVTKWAEETTRQEQVRGRTKSLFERIIGGLS